MATWTTPRIWKTGETITPAKFNTYVRDDLLYLSAGQAVQGVILRGTGTDVTLPALGAAASQLVSNELRFTAVLEPDMGFYIRLRLHGQMNGANFDRLIVACDGAFLSAPAVPLGDPILGTMPSGNAGEWGWRHTISSYPVNMSFDAYYPPDTVEPGTHTFELWHYNNAVNIYTYLLNGYYTEFTLIQKPALTRTIT